MKTLQNIYELQQLSNHNLKEISFELDRLLTSENTIDYNYSNKTDLVCGIYTSLESEGIDDETDMIDYLIGLVRDGSMELENH